MLLALGLVAAAALGGDKGAFADEPLGRRLAEVTDAPRFRHAHWGLLLVDLASGQVRYEQNADKLFVPASTTKLYSVAAALESLGADHRFETPLYRRGTLDDQGCLDGDLILVASGDPSLGGRTDDKGEIAFTDGDHTYANGTADARLTATDPLRGVDELARQTAVAGVKRIRGDVLIDDRLFQKSESTGSGPSRVTPILVNDNLIDVLVEPTEPDQPARVTWRPRTAAFSVDAQVKTVARSGLVQLTLHDLGAGRLRIEGQIPEGRAPVVRVHEAPDAAGFARQLLIEALQRAGVVVDAAAAAASGPNTPPAAKLPPRDAYAELPSVARLVSPPFSESARLILKVSHNLHASTLPLLVAARHGDRSLADGMRRQRTLLAGLGVDVDTISFAGGAGGARADYVTPRATVQLLRAISTRGFFPVFHRALPILGVDGTLAKTVDPESPARGQVRAKTGTLLWENTMNGSALLTSKALAGYLETSHGKTLAFAIYVNNVHLRDGVTAVSVGRDLGRLCEIIHRHE